MTINSKSIFLRRVEEAFLLKRINKKTATHFKAVYNKFDPKKAKKVFGYSILYLFLIFVIFLVENLI